jgi:hypothetical protein
VNVKADNEGNWLVCKDRGDIVPTANYQFIMLFIFWCLALMVDNLASMLQDIVPGIADGVNYCILVNGNINPL